MHAHELGPPVRTCQLIEVRELPASHRACANVAYFTTLNEVVESFHCFFCGDVGVITVDLEEIEVGGLQPHKRGVDRVENGCAGETTLIDVLCLLLQLRREVGADAWIVSDETEAFRCDHDLVTRDLILSECENGKIFGFGRRRSRTDRYLPDELGDETFRFAVGVDVGGVDGVDAEVPRRFHDRERRFFVQDPRLDQGSDHMRPWSHGTAGEEEQTHDPFR